MRKCKISAQLLWQRDDYCSVWIWSDNSCLMLSRPQGFTSALEMQLKNKIIRTIKHEGGQFCLVRSIHYFNLTRAGPRRPGDHYLASLAMERPCLTNTSLNIIFINTEWPANDHVHTHLSQLSNVSYFSRPVRQWCEWIPGWAPGPRADRMPPLHRTSIFLIHAHC